MADVPKTFAIDSAEGVVVHVDDSSENEKFNLTVLKDGESLEEHTGVTSETVGDLKSDHFTVEYIDPPVAEEPEATEE